MKVLLDSCVWSKARLELEAAGHETVWSGNWPSDPGDEEILAIAHAQKRVLVTLDKDFGELAVLQNQQHCGILRLAGISARRQGAVRLDVLTKHGDKLSSGAIITAEFGRLRIRLP